MSHPTSRAERRHQRERMIARRKFIHQHIWRSSIDQPWHEGKPEYQKDWDPFNEWGRYAKFNLNCGCKMCHSVKYYKEAHKRREARKNSWSTAEFRRLNKTCEY